MSGVLVVDDEPGMVDLLKWFLASKGHTVSTAADGPEALQKVQDERPDAVLLDINLPRMNGLEVLRRIRESDPEVGVIMVSGLSDKETSRGGNGSGGARLSHEAGGPSGAGASPGGPHTETDPVSLS